MVADARNLFKIKDQGMNRVGIVIVQVKLVAVLFFTLQKSVVFADQFTHIAPGILAPGCIERAQHGTTCEADCYFVIRQTTFRNCHGYLPFDEPVISVVVPEFETAHSAKAVTEQRPHHQKDPICRNFLHPSSVAIANLFPTPSAGTLNTMATSGAAEILLRYDDDQERQHFEILFGNDFTVQAFASDQAALDHLASTSTLPAAIVLVPNQPDNHLQSSLLAKARDQHPGILKILIGDAIALNLLVTLLDDQLIDRCFEQPVNLDVIRSHVLAAALTREEHSHFPDTGQALEGHRPAVLIVDDEPTATRYLSRQLEYMQSEFRVLSAASAEEALLTLRDDSNVAVVMTDQRMPGMHGKELLDELRQSHPTIVRILTSAWGEVDVAMDAVNEGRIFRYQKKPWHAGDLLILFRKALAHHRALVAARDSSRSMAAQQFAELRQQRRARLLDHLSEKVDGYTGEPITADFLDALATIRTLAAQPPHLRASRETALEHDLVRDFVGLVCRQLDTLEPGLMPATLNRQAFDQALVDAWESPGATSETQTPLAALCQSLATLLNASGLKRTALDITQAGAHLTVANVSALHIYSHLLAPITRLSRPLLEQQSALLMLFVSTRLLAGEIDVTGGDQSLRFSLRLPAGTD